MPKPRKKPGTRAIEKRLYILCEGAKDKSEYSYLNSFLKTCTFSGEKVEIKLVDTKKNTGRELVKEAKKCKTISVDMAWIVYDKDGYTLHSETFDMAKSNNINIAFSSICFEYWILLHFEYTTKPFEKCDDVVKYLIQRKYLNYSKSSLTTFDEVKQNLDNAIKNAKQIREHQIAGNPPRTPIYEFNPYTNMDELLEEILKLQKIK
jgi:hypothetical protein